MASNCISVEEDLCCAVCLEIFEDPIALPCKHSFCKKCLMEFMVNNKAEGCAICRRSSTLELPRSLDLKNWELNWESGVQEHRQESSGASEQLCSLHNKKLKLFCLDHNQLVCAICQKSKRICKKHNCRPVPEAADDLKREVETALKVLQETMDGFRQVKQTCHETTKHVKWQAENTERQIKEEFEKLYSFLRKEEAAKIAALRREQKKKSQMMKEMIEEMSEAIRCLSEDIRSIKQDLKGEDHLFLKNFKSCTERAQCTMKVPQIDSGTLIDVAKHLGNLKFTVWEKMKNLAEYTPIILDPNTAHPKLILSDDLTSVIFNATNPKNDPIECSYYNIDNTSVVCERPDNPERFDECACVLASEGFTSGRHMWDIDVRDSFLWEIGITTESNQRKGNTFYNGVWSVENNCGFYSRCPSQPKSALSAEGGLQRVRVQLDWEGGQISFFDIINDTEIISFTHCFTEKVYPFFWSRRINSPVTILPVTPLVLLEHN